MDDQPQKFVIQRASESKSEWWTGSGWSEDEADALFFDVEPMANEVTGDESATVYRQEIGKQRSARYAMSQCEVCGNEYDKAFTVAMGGKEHVFDSFECAIHALAPRCPDCGCRIIGHGVEHDGTVFCCANCAMHEGAVGLVDRV